MDFWNRKLLNGGVKAYSEFLDNKHERKFLTSYDELAIAEEEISDYEHSQFFINQSVQIMFNNFYSKIITQSATSLIDFLSIHDKPLISLSLKVDRQALKLQETEEGVVKNFTTIFNNLIKNDLEVTSKGMELQYDHK